MKKFLNLIYSRQPTQHWTALCIAVCRPIIESAVINLSIKCGGGLLDVTVNLTFQNKDTEKFEKFY